MRPAHGYLRDSVEVRTTTKGVELRFSVWSVDVPADTLQAQPRLAAFLRREIDAQALAADSVEAANLVTVLDQQGCLVPANEKPNYTQEEVLRFAIGFCNEAYGRYYGHPLWTAMRHQQIPYPLIRHWAARAYFRSRFAGVTAAVACLQAPDRVVRNTFLKSTLEEYAHCEVFYRPPPPLFPHPLGYTDGVAPTGSDLAFDQQMQYLARHHWLGHLLVALCQERTSAFQEGACQLYERIEQRLAMPDVLQGWRQHIELDRHCDHEADLCALLQRPVQTDHAQLRSALDEASFTIDLLIDGLTDTLTQGMSGRNPRARVTGAHLLAQHVTGLTALSSVVGHVIRAERPCGLIAELIELITGHPTGASRLADTTPLLESLIEHSLVRLSLETLTQASGHAEILCSGSMVDAASQDGLTLHEDASLAERPQRVLHSHLKHQARQPGEFAFHALLCLSLAETGRASHHLGAASAKRPSLRSALTLTVETLGDRMPLTHWVNGALDTLAVLEYAQQMQVLDYPATQFSLGHRAGVVA